MKIVITNPFEPSVDIDTPEKLQNYYNEISSLNIDDLYIELNNVRNAKSHLLMPPSINFADTFNKNRLIGDLNDKQIFICYVVFTSDVMNSYLDITNENEIRKFIEILDNIDEQVISNCLSAKDFGYKFINKLYETLADEIAFIIANILTNNTSNKLIAKQFVLDELKGAMLGNEKAKQLILNSGFSQEDINLKYYNENNEVDQIRNLLNSYCLHYAKYVFNKISADFRIGIVDHYMKIWELGKYAN